jgi:hypothetical protein
VSEFSERVDREAFLAQLEYADLTTTLLEADEQTFAGIFKHYRAWRTRQAERRAAHARERATAAMREYNRMRGRAVT